MNTPAGSGDRVLLAAGTKTYRHGADFAEPLANLERVPDALRWIVETLTGLGYEVGPTDARKYLLDPSLQQLKDSVRAAAGSASVVVIYYTGHGLKPDLKPYYLVTSEARPGPMLADTALEARRVLDLVLRQDAHGEVAPGDEQPQVLVILDCCFSGAGGAEALNESLQGMGNPKVWWLASAGSVEYAQQGRFATALRQALLDPDVGSSQPLLGLDSVADRINASLADAEQEARFFLPGGQSSGLPPFFPNPTYVPGVGGLTVAEQHWVSRLRGAPAGSAAAGFYVTGRTGRFRVVENLAEWMCDPDRGGLAVVTGSPGSGKSAMLALPVLLTDARGRDTLVGGACPGSLLARAADLFDGLPVFGVHARGMNPYQVAGAIAQYLGRAADSPGELLEDLDYRPETSSAIVVIDAVDEARDPRKLLTDLVLPLAQRPGLRIVVGARRHVVPPAADTSLIVDLDSDGYRDPQALADYAHQLLIAAREPDVPSPYRDRDDDTAVTVAAAIAKKATERPTAAGQEESFLLAQLLARAVRGRQQALDVTRAGWADQLPAGVGEAFDEDLRRLLGNRESAAWALLTALAWAKGPGLPWEGIWVPVAQALATQSGTGGQRLDHDDVRRLLDNARAYIVEDVGPGQRSVFRPFHDLLAVHLRGEPSSEQAAADPGAGQAWPQRRRQVERDITQVLLDSVRAFPDGTADWQLAHPYLCTYLAQHARAAGPDTFAGLVADLDYLAVADPAILTPILTPTDPALRRIARPYRRARPLLGHSARDNSAYLQEAIVAQTDSHPTGQRIRPTYRTLMARVRRDDSLLTLTGHAGWMPSVAFGTSADGEALLAAGAQDGTVRLWDVATGTPAGPPLTGHTGLVKSVAFGTGADGRSLLASGSDDRTVRLWDVATGTPAGPPLTGHTSAVWSVAFGTDADGRPLLASGSGDGTVRLWDIDARTPAEDLFSSFFGSADDGRTARLWDVATGTPDSPLTGHTSAVFSVAFGTGAEGRPLLATGSGDGTVRLWDVATGTLAGPPLTGHTSAVWSVAFGAGADGRPLLATGSGDSTVRLWDIATRTPDNPLDESLRMLRELYGGYDMTERPQDIATGTPAGPPLTGHTSDVLSVAFGTGADGRSLLATGSKDATVRLWDPATGTQTGPPLTGHTSDVLSVAFGTGADGRSLLATGGSDETVRLWDPVTGTPAGPPLPGHTRMVTSVAFGTGADGRSLLATGSGDQTARLWDPVTGTPAGPPLTGHTRTVWSVAFGTGADGRSLLATGSADGTARLWDPVTGTPAGPPLTGHTSDVFSVAFGTGADGKVLLATGSADRTVRLWDVATGTPAGPPLTGHTSMVWSVAFGTGADGRALLASGSDSTVRLWDIATGTPAIPPLTGHTGWVRSVAFGTSTNGRAILATGGDDKSVRLWDPVTGDPAGPPLTGHTSAVRSLAFGTGADGRALLASASYDETVRLWDPVTARCVFTLPRRSYAMSVAVAGALMAIGDAEGVSVIELDA